MALPRSLTAGTKTESLKGSGAKYVVFVKMEFDAGDERLWNGRGPMSFDDGSGGGAEVYTGGGFLGAISVIEESQEQRAFGVSILLSGLPLNKDYLNIAETEDVIGRPITIWISFLDDDYVVISDPAIVFQGLMDTMTIEIGSTMSVSLTAENRLNDWARARIRRFTSASHKERFPNDDGFDFVTDAVEREIVWGGIIAGGGGGGGGAISTTTTTGGGRTGAFGDDIGRA